MAACEALTEHHPGVQLIICDTCRMFVLNFHLECTALKCNSSPLKRDHHERNVLFQPSKQMPGWQRTKSPQFPGFLGISGLSRLLFGTWKDSLLNGWLISILVATWQMFLGIPLRDWNLANLWNSPDKLDTPFELIMGFTFGHRVMSLVNGMVHIPIVGCCRW